MKNVRIRMAESHDLTACHTIECKCFPPSEAALISSMNTRITEYPEGYLVAELDGHIVGQVNSGATDKDDITDEEFKQLIGHDPEGKNIVIFSLSVLPEFQRRGIADQLMKAFIKQARKLDKQRILLLCKDNLIPYYARHGFTDSGVSESDHGGAEWHEMALTL
ncbi:GNAT family N-acetyltransferase [Pseudodesulfovibrio sp. JC047]|uniref:GNAT family N-acetyltransferase n=1 Tax=Pseudodesulfovibrio sp. JC047 TaxID=2683199 RepID=UPI0013D69EDA|nr:GNAT family N-acetyltransferase [Pseudodesulfovibrio sp. JC047]NDV17907.1 GNAT family N-acetyltransferase [Pseudodesulfovibrio sp. JC047]